MSERPRVAVVSGGSSGIGRAFVAQLQAEGYRVVACGRDERKLQQLERNFPGVCGDVCDVADPQSVFAFARTVQAQFGAVDLLVSNAGGSRERDFTRDDLSSGDLGWELRVNLEGAVNFIAAFLPALRAAGSASIIVVTSGYALAPATRAPLYSAAKAGLRSFTKALRRQLAPLRIGVTEVAPPVVDTPSVAHRAVPKMAPEAVVRMALSAARRGQAEVYPGQVRWLPLLLRLAPRLAERMVAKT